MASKSKRALLAVLCSTLFLAACGETDSAESESASSVATTPQTASLSLTAAAASTPRRAPSNGKILFTSNRSEKSQIYVMNSDGSEQICLTNGVYHEYDPEWSPDHTRIAFSSTRGGYLGDIYLMNADGSDPTQLTFTKGFDTTVRNMDAAWSPDGSRIAFTITGGLGPLSRVHTLRVPTGEHFRSGHVPQAITVHDRLSSYTNPAWSPDGSQIATTQFTATLFASLLKINVMDIDGTDPYSLINRLVSEDETAWSPDGSKIAYTGFMKSGTREIYVINADRNNEIKLTDNRHDDLHPTWSPDGLQIAFSSNRSGRFEIYVMDADGSNVQQITQEGGYEPDWEPGMDVVLVPRPTITPTDFRGNPKPNPPRPGRSRRGR